MRAYLQLIRLPTVFTAIADVVLGVMLTQRGITSLPKFFGLLGATCGLYLAGMVFNDVFDLAQDQRERPSRPIPSGRVSRTAAIALGVGLMLIGLVSASTVSPPVLMFAGGLVVAILAYDALLKRTFLGPLAMGSCRFLNVMMAASSTYERWHEPIARPQLVVAIALGVYIIGVTWFARTEARVSSRWQLTGALTVMNLGYATLAALMASWPGEADFGPSFAILCFIAVSVNMRALAVIRNPVPELVQPMIGLFLMNYVTTAAAVVYWHTGNGTYALATAALVIPPMILRRWIPMS